MTTSQQTIYIEEKNRLNREYNAKLHANNARAEALIKKCQRSQCSYTNRRADCHTCKRSVHTRSKYTSYPVPTMPNRRVVPAEPPVVPRANAGWKPEWNDMFNADTANINQLQAMFDRVSINASPAVTTAFNNEIEQLGQERVRKLTARIQEENESARFKQVTDECKAIFARLRALEYNQAILKKCANEWKVYIRRVKESTLHCPHCYSEVKHGDHYIKLISRRAQVQRARVARFAIKSEVK